MPNPVILFIGEAPGRHEDEENRPFVGDSGQLLRSFIMGNGSDIDGYITVPWRITNVVRCRPYLLKENGTTKKDRKPTIAEIEACSPYLAEEIEAFKPKVIVALGETALTSLMGSKYLGITKWRGTVLESNGYIIIPTFHPSYVMGNLKDPRSIVPRQFQQDIVLANDIAINGKPKGADVNIIIPRTIEELRQALTLLESKDELAFDVETNSYEGTEVRNIWSKGFKLLSVSFAFSERDAIAIPLFHKDSPFAGEPTLGGEYGRIIRLIQTKTSIAHNGKFDLEAIWRQWGVLVEHKYDTMLAHYLLEEERGTHALEDLMKTYCPELSIWKTKKNTYEAEIKKKSYEAIPLEELLQYNAYDTLGTFKLRKVFDKMLLEYPKRQEAFETLFMPVCHMLARVEIEGLVPSLKVRDELSSFFATKLDIISKTIKDWAEAHEMKNFNPGSPKQLSVLLYEKMELPVIELTKQGAPSTNDDALLQLRTRVSKDAKKFIDLIISHIDENGVKTDSYRGLTKLLGTYVNTLEEYVGEDGKIHTDLWQHGTVTGRLSAKNPNMQNQPPVIRKMYVAPEGYKCVEADYSQAELRLLAVLANEEVMKEVFKSGGDIHHKTTTEIFASEIVTAEMRRKGKETNFGIVYRESAKGLSEKLNITVKEAQRYIDTIFYTYPGLKTYFEDQEYLAREYGYVETPFGNVRHLRGMDSDIPSIAAEAARQAVNSPIQGGAGLLCLSKMARLAKAIDWKDCRMILNVHDSVWFYIKFNEMFHFWIETIKATMEDTRTLPFKVDIPFPIDIKIGDNFFEMVKIEVTNEKVH